MSTRRELKRKKTLLGYSVMIFNLIIQYTLFWIYSEQYRPVGTTVALGCPDTSRPILSVSAEEIHKVNISDIALA